MCLTESVRWEGHRFCGRTCRSGNQCQLMCDVVLRDKVKLREHPEDRMLKITVTSADGRIWIDPTRNRRGWYLGRNGGRG